MNESGGSPHRSSFTSRSSSRLLILRLSALGDVIHTLPAVVGLREALPESELEWVVEAPYRELVEIAGRVRAIPVRLKRWAKSPWASREDIAAARKAMRGADTAIDFQGLVKSAVLARLSGARDRYGFARGAIREKAALLFTNHQVPVDTTRHVVEQNIELARAIAPSLTAGEPAWDEFARDESGRLRGLEDSIVFLPSTGKPNKEWPVARFAELARRLGDKVLVVWGPGEQERAAAIGARLAPTTDLRELAWLLRSAQLVIGGDTGPLHLAAAMGTRVIGLYGPTSPRRNGPYGQLDRCIDKSRLTKSMDAISVEEVMTLVERVERGAAT